MMGHISDELRPKATTREESFCNSSLEPEEYRSTWHFTRKDLENKSPSRKDGIDWMAEDQLRHLYCSFIQNLGIELRVPQLMIATAIMFCHRFYLHQSHAKNNWQTVSTVCLFLASKVEETPCLLDKVVVLAYKLTHGNNSSAAQRIHVKDVFAKQKELILIGERLLLSTIGFDFNIQHPYKPLVAAFKKFKLHNDVLRIAWNYVNDWVRTTLCLQYRPHYIAAGSLYIAAKLSNVELPSQNDGFFWWHEFDVLPRQLQEVIQQMTKHIGFMRAGISPCAEGRKTDAPLLGKAVASSPELACADGKRTNTSCLPAKEATTPSPESCILSRAGSDNSSPAFDFSGDGAKLSYQYQSNGLVPSCSNIVNKESQCHCAESLNCTVDDGEGACPKEEYAGTETAVATGNEIASVSVGLDKRDMERIRAKLKRRRWERETKKVSATDDSTEDALEKELESGIELEMACKRTARPGIRS